MHHGNILDPETHRPEHLHLPVPPSQHVPRQELLGWGRRAAPAPGTDDDDDDGGDSERR